VAYEDDIAEEAMPTFKDDGDAVTQAATENAPFLGTEMVDPELEQELQGELQAELDEESSEWQEIDVEGHTMEFPASMSMGDITEVLDKELGPIFKQGKEAIDSWFNSMTDPIAKQADKENKAKEEAKPVQQVDTGNKYLTSILKYEEGYRDKGYYATDKEKEDGLVTVGYGSTKRVKHGEQVTEQQAEQWLKEDSDDALSFVRQHFPDLDQWQEASVASLVYNVGRTAFLKSRAYKALKKGEVDNFIIEAFDEDEGFVRQGKTKLKGLQDRRARERDLFHTSQRQRKADIEEAITKLEPGSYMVDGELIEVS